MRRLAIAIVAVAGLLLTLLQPAGLLSPAPALAAATDDTVPGADASFNYDSGARASTAAANARTVAFRGYEAPDTRTDALIGRSAARTVPGVVRLVSGHFFAAKAPRFTQTSVSGAFRHGPFT